MHLPIARHILSHHSQGVTICSTRMQHKRKAIVDRKLQLLCKDLSLRSTVVPVPPKPLVRIIQSELTPSHSLATTPLHGCQQLRLELVSVSHRTLRVTTEAYENFPVLHSKLLRIDHTFRVTTLGDTAQEACTEEVAAGCQLCHLRGVPGALGEAQPSGSILRLRRQFCPRAHFLGAGVPRLLGTARGRNCCSASSLPMIPRVFTLPKYQQTALHLSAQLFPRLVTRQMPPVQIPSCLTPAELNSCLALFRSQ
mmetsp:Transcript_129886/g.238878  ORF Transcript_129886/g.238878 Transcript_129886/m.238878 type:complete len:253 (-) Transcript_129886:293-1051(-)